MPVAVEHPSNLGAGNSQIGHGMSCSPGPCMHLPSFLGINLVCLKPYLAFLKHIQQTKAKEFQNEGEKTHTFEVL